MSLLADSLDASQSTRLSFEPIARVGGQQINEFWVMRRDDRLASSLLGRVGKPREPGLNLRQREMAFGLIEAKRVSCLPRKWLKRKGR